MKLLTVLPLAFLMFAGAAGNALAVSNEDFQKTIDGSNFLLNNNCSATLIDAEKGYILTASHCILDQYSEVERDRIDENGVVTKEKVRIAVPGKVIQLFYKNFVETKRVSYEFKLKDTDSQLDLALLKVDVKFKKEAVAQIGCTAPKRLDIVWAVGNAYVTLYTTVTKGIVSSLNRSYRDLKISGQLGDATDNGEHSLIQHSAQIAPGSSGGALYNDKGKIVGVNVRGIPGFAFAVPLSDIKKFLERNDAGHLLKDCNVDK